MAERSPLSERIGTQRDTEHHQTFKVTDKFAMKYLETEKGSKMLSEVQSTNRVEIRLNQAPEIVLVTENIEDQTTSAIVNSVSPNLDLNVAQSTIALAIFKKGGKEFQKILHEANPQGVKYNDVVISRGAGGLDCSWVFNCCLEGHQTNTKSKNDLTEVIKKCLQETKANPNRYMSIAFPTLCTGIHKYPADIAAKAMFDAIVSFCSDNVDFQLKTIRIVVFPRADREVNKQFTDEYQRRVASDSPLVELTTDNIASGYVTLVTPSQGVTVETIEVLNQRIRNRRRHHFSGH